MRMLLLLLCVILIGCQNICFAQNKDYQDEVPALLEKFNDGTVTYILVSQLMEDYKNYTVLDTRRRAEYDVSHLPGAIWVGSSFNKKDLEKIPADKPIVVYCTIGARSETYGKNLMDNGFKNVLNLYGSIFYWKDAGHELVNKYGKPTDTVHVFSKRWGKYLRTGVKVY